MLNASITTICNGSSSILTQSGGSLGTGAHWQWYTNNTYTTPIGGNIFSSNASLTVSPTSTTTYYLRVEGTTSPCTSTLVASGNVTIVVNQPSVAPSLLNASITTICNGSSSILTQSGGSLGTGAHWQWYTDNTFTNPIGGNLNSSNASLTVSPTSTTTYYLRAEGTSSPCTGTLIASGNVTIVVNQPSVASTLLNASITTICNGSSSILTQSGGSLGTGAHWQWYTNNTYTTPIGGNIFSSNASLTVSPTSTTTYYLRVEGTTSPCTSTLVASGNVTIVVNQPSVAPSLLNASITSICNGSSSILTQSGGSLGTGAHWQWYTDNTFTNPIGGNLFSSNASLTVSPTSTTIYYLRAEGTTSPCTGTLIASGSITIIVNQPSIAPTLLNASITTICNGNNSILTQSGGSLGTGAHWQWYTDNTFTNPIGGNIFFPNASLTVSPTSTTTYYLRVEGTTSPCTGTLVSSGNVTIVVKPLPSFTNPFSQTICSGNNTSLVNLTSNLSGTTFNWLITSVSNGISGFINNTYNPNSIIPIQTLINTSNIPGIVKYTVTPFSNGCTGLDSNYIITVNPLPTLNAGFDTSICKGTNAFLKATNGLVTYNWSPTLGLSNSTIYNPIASPTSTTIYTVIGKDINNCINTDNITITVNSLPIISVGASDTIICNGESTNLFASGGTSYSWTPMTNINFPFISTPIASPHNTTTYSVTAIDNNSCSSTKNIKITVNPLPLANAGNDTSICYGTSVNLHATGGIDYKWGLSPDLSNLYVSNPTAFPQSTTNYIVTVKNSYGCSMTDTIKVIVNPLPNIHAGINISICKGSNTTLNASGGSTYNWTPITGLSIPNNIPNPSANPTVTTTYILTALDTNHCQGKDSVTISVLPLPTPTISGNSIACKNEYWTKYNVQPTSNSLYWEITNGHILTGQYTNTIKVHWSNSDSNGLIKVTEHLWNTPYCSGTDSLNVSLTKGFAPEPAYIIAKSNDITTGILLCKYCSFPIYKWGHENINSPSNEIYDDVSSNNVWYNYGIIDINNNYYWVKVGSDLNCLTKSYFNTPPVINSIDNIASDIKFLIYPNPNNGIFNIEYTSLENGDISVLIISTLGNEMKKYKFHKNTDTLKEIINTGDLNKGIYFLDFNINNSHSVRKICIY